MARLVIDTNCLIQCISRKSVHYPLWRSLLSGRHALCVTTDILAEYAEVIERNINSEVAEAVLDAITNNAQTRFIAPYYRFNLIAADPDDNKFVDCAIAAGAKFIVTNDRHYDALLSLGFPKVDIIRLDDAMAQLL